MTKDEAIKWLADLAGRPMTYADDAILMSVYSEHRAEIRETPEFRSALSKHAKYVCSAEQLKEWVSGDADEAALDAAFKRFIDREEARELATGIRKHVETKEALEARSKTETQGEAARLLNCTRKALWEALNRQ